MRNIVILLLVFSTPVWATPVNVNTADAQTIADALSNIGIKKAEAIVAYRNKNGAFKSVEALGDVTGIGDKTLEKNKADILLSDPVTVGASGTPNKSEKKN